MPTVVFLQGAELSADVLNPSGLLRAASPSKAQGECLC